VTAIRVTRPATRWRDLLRRYRILIDGREVGRLRRDATQQYPVLPGSHTVQARIDWTGSPELPVTVEEGQVLDLVVRPRSPTRWLSIPDHLKLFFGRDRWLILEVQPRSVQSSERLGETPP
jgi:hypothetical protein